MSTKTKVTMSEDLKDGSPEEVLRGLDILEKYSKEEINRLKYEINGHKRQLEKIKKAKAKFTPLPKEPNT
jgi:hypothetical protein